MKEASGPGGGGFFLDRDGTFIEDVGYLSRIDQIRLLPGAVEAIRLINETGRPALVVTNQSGVGRGLIPEEAVSQIHRELARLLERRGARISAFYHCPHHPEAVVQAFRRVCNCRKPQPGMLLRAAQDWQLDLTRSFILGDTLRDIEAGRRAGCRAVLLKTGKGRAAEAALAEAGSGLSRPQKIAEDLLSGVRWILETQI